MSTAEETYKKILNVFFIILLIVLLCIAGYLIYKFISAKIINDDSDEYIAEFTNEIGDIDGNIISDDTTTTTAESDENTKGFFKKEADSDIEKLPQCLDISRRIRELEIGKGYFQVENTRLLCSCYYEHGAQLYKIERFEPSEPYELIPIKPMDITVWMFNPNIDAISVDLQNLYIDLKDYAEFYNQEKWINYYINRIAPIYQKQSQVDSLMSQSFDIFFQTKDEYVFGHLPNTQNTALEFKDISINSGSI